MSCLKCKKLRNQICRLSGVGYFDVEKALKIVEKFPRKRLRLTKKELISHLKRQHINIFDEHLKHINKVLPILIGQIEDHRFMLDGNHRALKHYLSGIPVFYYLLTEFETGQIFREKPPKGTRYISYTK